MKVAIFAELTQDQLSYLQNLASQNGIVAEYVIEESPVQASTTPITGEMLQAVAENLSKSVLEVASMAASLGIETVEQALAHSEIPSTVKSILEQYV